MSPIRTLPSIRPFSVWPLAEAAKALGAAPIKEYEGRSFGPVSTDSRSLAPGDFFLALRGEKFDGHNFCAAAVERGAAGLIVDQKFEAAFDKHVLVLKVEDTLRAYGDLAHYQRRCWGGRVIAISGSVGKTTTRRLTARALAAKWIVLEPTGNFNNLIGLPQTLLRLAEPHEAAVLELGMNMPGELRRLAEIAAPTVAGLTRIGRAHIGMFDSLEELIEAKLSLFEATAPGTPLVINAACENSRAAFGRFGSEHPITTFRGEGTEPADCTIENVRRLADLGFGFDLTTPAGQLKGLELRHFGRHLLEDVAAAAGLLVASGEDPALLVEAVSEFETEPLRGQIVKAGAWTFILDCYNAPPEAMSGGLASLTEAPGDGRLVVVLADMLELGEHSRATHEALLEPLRRLAPAPFFGLGPEMSRLAEILKGEGREASGFSDANSLADALRKRLQPGDRVYFKGSHSFALEKVAQAVAPNAPIVTKKAA